MYVVTSNVQGEKEKGYGNINMSGCKGGNQKNFQDIIERWERDFLENPRSIG